MNQKQGFKNCPSVTAWAVGMEFQWRAAKYRVLHTIEGGQTAAAVLLSSDKPDDVPYPRVQLFGRYEDRGPSNLDLDSVWVDREYMGDETVGDNRTKVRAVNDDVVAYSERGELYCTSRSEFREHWKPLPLTAPAETSVDICSTCRRTRCVTRMSGRDYCGQSYLPISPAPAEKPTWTPKLGWPCLYIFGCAPEARKKVVPMAYDEEECVWVCSRFGESGYIGIPVGQLSPLPPEPPVKEGDIICLEDSGYERIGRMHWFNVADGIFSVLPPIPNDPLYHWGDKKVTVTKLVPEKTEHTTQNMDTELLTSREVENLLRYSPGQATRLAKRGKLPYVTLPDGSIRFDRAAILGLLQRTRRPSVEDTGEAV
jgi:hypothetical protein